MGETVMRILITGAKGFVGKNLVAALKNLQEGKDRTRPELKIDEIFAYDLDSSGDLLHVACQKADFVFHLAGSTVPKILRLLCKEIWVLPNGCWKN